MPSPPLNVNDLVRRMPSPQKASSEVIRPPLSTSGRHIIDSLGRRVKLACLNWYGAHMEQFSVGGLHKSLLIDLASRVSSLGFNCVRLPVSAALVMLDPPVLPAAVAANPELVHMALSDMGLSGMQLLDIVIAALTSVRVVVILNDHNSAAGWCCEAGSDEGLWWTDAWPVKAWLDTLSHLARRYRDVRAVVGIDIRNEIHDAAPLHRFISYGRSENVSEDWRAAAEAGANAVLAANPNLLIIVEGLCSGFDLRLIAASSATLPKLNVSNKLVLSTHYYPIARWWLVVEERLLAPLSFVSLRDFWVLPGCACVCVLIALGGLALAVGACCRTDRDEDELHSLVVETDEDGSELPAVPFDFHQYTLGRSPTSVEQPASARARTAAKAPSEAWRRRCASTWPLVCLGLLLAVSFWSGVAALSAGFAANLFREGYAQAGCRELERLEPAALDLSSQRCALVCAVALALAAIGALATALLRDRRSGSTAQYEFVNSRVTNPTEVQTDIRSDVVHLPCRRVAAPVGVAASALAAVPLLLYVHSLVELYASPVEAMDADLRAKWRLDALTVPLWVGEWAPWHQNDRASDRGFVNEFSEVLRRHDLDWAIWAYNGDAWVAENTWRNWSDARFHAPPFGTSGYRNEDAGLLDEEWRQLRHPDALPMLQSLQRVQGAGDANMTQVHGKNLNLSTLGSAAAPVPTRHPVLTWMDVSRF